jgi:RNA polymerase sigma-B factor
MTEALLERPETTESETLVALNDVDIELLERAALETEAEQPEQGADDLAGPMTAEQEQIVIDHVSMAQRIARKHYYRYNRDLPLHEPDLMVSDAYLGLVKGAKKFDEHRKHQEATSGVAYLYATVFGEVRRGVRGRYGRKTITINDEKTGEPLKDETGKTITKEVTRRWIPSAVLGTAESLEEPLGNDPDNSPLGEVLESKSAETELEIRVEDSLFVPRLIRALRKQEPRQRAIFFRRVLLGESQTEIAKAVGISQMHVSRMLKRMAKDFEGDEDLALALAW